MQNNNKTIYLVLLALIVAVGAFIWLNVDKEPLEVLAPVVGQVEADNEADLFKDENGNYKDWEGKG